MQNNTTKIIVAIIAILALGTIATFAINNKTQSAKDLMSKSSEIMKKTEDSTKMAMDKMKAEEAMMKKDAMSKSSDVMMKRNDLDNKKGCTEQELSKIKIEAEKKIKDYSPMCSNSIPGKPLSDQNLDKMIKDLDKEGDAMSKDMKNKTGEISSPTGMYSQYSVNNLAQNSTGTNVIFFHAPWCPSCKSIDTEINANLDKLPENFQILKADFDTSTALKQKYGITSQSTFVKVDKDGNKIGTASPAFQLKTVDDIIAFGSK